MDFVLGIAAAVILVPLIIIFLVFAFITEANNKNSIESAAKREEHGRQEAEFDANREALRQMEFHDWAVSQRATVDGQRALIGMRADGSELRILICRREGNEFFAERDEVIHIKDVCGINIDQQTKKRTIVHKSSTPVAVNSGRSAGTRALAGAMIAGPVGAIIGGASGLGGKTRIEHVETRHLETVEYETQPKLVVQIRDVVRPRRVLAFDSVAELNDWSSRIWGAMPHR